MILKITQGSFRFTRRTEVFLDILCIAIGEIDGTFVLLRDCNELVLLLDVFLVCDSVFEPYPLICLPIFLHKKTYHIPNKF